MSDFAKARKWYAKALEVAFDGREKAEAAGMLAVIHYYAADVERGDELIEQSIPATYEILPSASNSTASLGRSFSQFSAVVS